MPSRRLAVAFVAIAAIAAPAGASFLAPIGTERLALGESPRCSIASSGFPFDGNVAYFDVIQGMDSWMSLWDCLAYTGAVEGSPSSIDFAHEVVLVAMENGRDGDCALEIAAMEAAPAALARVAVQGAKVAPDCAVGAGVTFDLHRAPRRIGHVSFEDAETGEIVYSDLVT